jgi:hypothetical protein
VESVSSAKMVETRLNLGKEVSVGCGGQVSKLTDMLACIKWPTYHLRYEVASEGWVMGAPG